MVIVAGNYACGFFSVVFFTTSDMWIIGNSEGCIVNGEYIPGLPVNSIWG